MTEPLPVPPANESLHRQVFEGNLAVQLVIDPSDGRIVDANPAASRFYGYPREVLTTLRITDINVLPPDDVAANLKLAEAGRRRRFQFRHRLASGELREVEVTSGPVEVDGRRLLYSIVHDVSEQHRAELERHLSEDRFRSVAENLAEGVVVTDLAGVALYVNPRICALTGWDAASLVGQRAHDLLVPQEHLEELRSRLQRRAEGVAESYALELRRRDGSTFWAEVHGTPLRDAAGRVVGTLATISDVTERLRAEAALRASEEKHREILASIEEGYYEADLQGHLTFVNEGFARAVGVPLEEARGANFRDYVDAAEAARVAGLFREVFRSGRSVKTVNFRMRRSDGTPHDVAASVTPMRDATGRVVGFRGVARDVTESRAAERLQHALYRIAQLTASVRDLAQFYAAVHAVVGELMYARNFYIALIDECGQNVSFPYFVDEFDAVVPVVQPGTKSLTHYVLRTGEPLLASPAVFQKLVERAEVESVGGPSIDWLGVPLKLGEKAFGVLVVQSYTESVRYTDADRELLTFVSRHVATALERTRSAEALRESEARFRTLAETAPCGIFIYQGERFRYVNAAGAAISGYTREELVGRTMWDLVHPDFRETVRERGLARQRGEAVTSRYEFRISRRDGSERWIDFSAATLTYEGGPAGIGIAIDITERKRAEERIRDLAYHDPLTGLPNRMLFGDRLEVALAQAHRHGEPLALLFLDVDRFKAVNDALGHAFGDLLLRGIAARLRALVREGDTVARLSGDEFVLLLPGVGRGGDAARVAEKILEALREPFDLDGRELAVSASLGIAAYPDDCRDAETLLRCADQAMYRAKQAGRDNFQAYAVEV